MGRGAPLSELRNRRRGLDRRPKDYLASGERWPEGALQEPHALHEELKTRLAELDRPGEHRHNEQELAELDDELATMATETLQVVRFVKELAIRLKQQCDNSSIYQVATGANVNPQTVTNFLNGETWGDVVVIFRLERAGDGPLWNYDHLSQPSRRNQASVAVGPQLRRKRRPFDYLTAEFRTYSDSWPAGRLQRNTPHSVHFIKELATELQQLCDEESIDNVAEYSGIDVEEITDFLNGETWEDIEFIFRLEHALNERLWSHDHLSPRWANEIRRNEPGE